MDAAVVDEAGEPVVDTEGELVLRELAQHDAGAVARTGRYIESYWSTLPGLWVQGDRAVHHADGSWEIIGRSDDVMKIAGKRVGPTEWRPSPPKSWRDRGGRRRRTSPTKGQVAVLWSWRPRPESTTLPSPMRLPIDRHLLRKAPAARGRARGRCDAAHQIGKDPPAGAPRWVSGQDPGDLSTLENPRRRLTSGSPRSGREDYDEFAYVRHFRMGAVRRT